MESPASSNQPTRNRYPRTEQPQGAKVSPEECENFVSFVQVSDRFGGERLSAGQTGIGWVSGMRTTACAQSGEAQNETFVSVVRGSVCRRYLLPRCRARSHKAGGSVCAAFQALCRAGAVCPANWACCNK